MEALLRPVAYSPMQVCKIVGIGKTRLYQAIQRGDLRAKKVGRRTLILDCDLQDWLGNLHPIVANDNNAIRARCA